MSKRISYMKAAPEAAKGFLTVHGYLAQSGLDKNLVDLVYLRVSQINHCAYCIDMHSQDLNKHGVPFEKLIDSESLVTMVRYIEPNSDFHRLARFLETYVNE